MRVRVSATAAGALANLQLERVGSRIRVAQVEGVRAAKLQAVVLEGSRARGREKGKEKGKRNSGIVSSRFFTSSYTLAVHRRLTSILFHPASSM